jgi:hypothetical protein
MLAGSLDWNQSKSPMPSITHGDGFSLEAAHEEDHASASVMAGT